jgi:plastocyanin/acyl CoA:acetate/3-ketoacid CoA transferase alpha subunit
MITLQVPFIFRQLLLWALGIGFFGFMCPRTLTATTFTVAVAPPNGGSPTFAPDSVSIQPGDTVMWVWKDTPDTPHTVTSGTPTGGPTGLFESGLQKRPFTFSFTFPNPGTFDYYCIPHAAMGMIGTVIVAGATPSPTPTPGASSQLLNISTRERVQTGENVMIGGFIITGNAAKKVVVRGLGPSLQQAGLTDLLADPVLDLRASAGSLIASNDNWKDTQQAEIQATGVAPQNDLESAIVASLNPGGYTATVSGKAATAGVGLVEVYDLDTKVDSKLANISTRGLVQSGSSVMIGGFILGNGNDAAKVLARGIGPSLAQAGVSNPLADPRLELHDANGALVQSNDNWKDTQADAIQATGAAPTNDLEAALVATLAPGSYTAIVSGKNTAAGVGLVELFKLQ